METKFRGKTKDGEFVYGDLVRFANKAYIIAPNGFTELHYQKVTDWAPFTGVRDKNGEELYLGDSTNFGTIIFENGCFGIIGEIGFFNSMHDWNLNRIEKL